MKALFSFAQRCPITLNSTLGSLVCLTQVFPREPVEGDLDGYFKDRVMLVLVFFLTTLGFIFPFHIQTAVFFSENLKTGLPSQHRADSLITYLAVLKTLLQLLPDYTGVILVMIAFPVR